MRWFLEEIYRLEESEMYNSVWITKRLGELYYELRPDVTVHLYVSTLPCASKFRDAFVKALF